MMAFSVCKANTGTISTASLIFSTECAGLAPARHVFPSKCRSSRMFTSALRWKSWNAYAATHRPTICCRATHETDGGRDKEPGDEKLQGILVDMIRVQSDRVRVTEFVDEKTRLLNGIAEGAKEEYQRLAEETMKNMDVAGNKVMEQVEADALKLEEELASARQQMEKEDRDFEEFEKKVEESRSRGLFFKSLYGKPVAQRKSLSAQQVDTIREVQTTISSSQNKAAGSKTRRYLYGILLFLVTLTLIDLASADVKDWPKLALYSILCLSLIAQLAYEKFLSSNGNSRKK